MSSPKAVPFSFQGDTVDDLMRTVIHGIRDHGTGINPSRGKARELRGALLELSNPLARLSRTETRGRLFSCLGELCWYLAQTNAVDFIAHYIPKYRLEAEGDLVYGGYGPRLFNWKGQDQIQNVINLLRQKPSSRRAVIQVFDAADLAAPHTDIPCTCYLQFLVRGDALHMFTSMRSNDAFVGLPHDVFCFTMIQELIARSLGLGLGTYQHAVASLHLYEADDSAAEAFINEGWQATDEPMPPMPSCDPWSSVKQLVQLESVIRQGGHPQLEELGQLEQYWADLVRILQVFDLNRQKDVSGIAAVLSTMSSRVFDPFIQAKLDALQHKGI